MTAKKKPARRYPGKIDQLPAEFRELIGKLLSEGWTKTAITQALNAELKSQGKRPVSRHAVNRYTSRMLEEGKRIREARDAAKSWAQVVGPIDGSEIDAYLVELVRVLAIDHMHLFKDGEEKPSIKELSDMALSMKRLVEASAQTEQRIARARAEARTEAAAQATEAAREAGLSDATIRQVRQKVLGISEG